MTGTAFLNWTAADFSGENANITLNLATGDTNEWTLLDAATTTVYGTFKLQVKEIDVAAGLTLGTAIAGTGTAYDGWGFALEDTVLKFKNLA